MKRVIHAFVALSLLISTARAGPEFRVVTGLLTLFEGGRKTPIRYNTQTDANFEEGGSVRVFSTVTPEGLAEVEVMARSKVVFYFLGADVTLAPSGTIRATVDDIKHPEIKLTWEGGTASASKIRQTPEELLSYFIVSQPPVFSKSPIADDELSRIYPPAGLSGDLSRPGSFDAKDAVEVYFPFAAPSPTNDPSDENAAKPTGTASPRPKPSPSPHSRPTPVPKDSDKAFLAQVAHSASASSPTPKSASANARQTPEEKVAPAPSPTPELMPDLPMSGSDSLSTAPETILGGRPSTFFSNRASAAQPHAKPGAAVPAPSLDVAPILKSLRPGAGATATPTGLASGLRNSVRGSLNREDLASRQMDLLDGTGVQAPKEMPTMHAPIAKQVPDFLPLIVPSGSGPDSQPRRQTTKQTLNQARGASLERPDIVLGGQKEFAHVLRALPAGNDRERDIETVAQKPERAPDPVLLDTETLAARGPGPQTTPFVISSAITRKNPFR